MGVLKLNMRGGFILFLAFVFAAYAQLGWAQTSADPSNPTQDKLNQLLAQPLFESALEYTDIPKLEDCTERTIRPPAYHACRDSADIYAKALANAKAKNQPLMVVFGFDSCPNCRRMHKQVFHPKHPMRNADIIKYFSKPAISSYVLQNKPLKVSVVRIHARSKHGLKLADDLGVTKMAQARGWHRVWSPFVLFVNPHSGHMSSESYWDPKEIYCDWGADFAASIESVGMVQVGRPYTERKRCN